MKARTNLISTVVTGLLVAVLDLAKRIEVIIDMTPIVSVM